MSRKEELASLYKKERRRVQAYYSKYRRQNYSIPENAIPAIPKRITEGSIRRLQKMTPEYMKRKLVREEKRIQREEKRQLIETKSPTDRMNIAEAKYDKSITDMTKKELSQVGFTKTDSGFILDTDTGEIVARDMSKEQAYNEEFIQDIQQETGQDLSGFQDVDFTFNELVRAAEEGIVNLEIRRNDKGEVIQLVKPKEEAPKRDFRQDIFRGSAKSSWAQSVINHFIRDIRKFERTAYPLLADLMNELLRAADDKTIGSYKEALANAIQSTVNELGRMTKDIAYDGQLLDNYAATLEQHYSDNIDALKSLNAELEQNDTGYENH